MAVSKKTISFSAPIKKKGINPYVDIPKQVSKFFTKRGNIPVKGMLNATRIQATLVSIGNNRHILYINGQMRKAASVKVGDRINLALDKDSKPRIKPIPKQLKEALNQNPRAKGYWENLAPSRQKEILIYLNHLKTEEALKKNIKKMITRLNQE